MIGHMPSYLEHSMDPKNCNLWHNGPEYSSIVVKCQQFEMKNHYRYLHGNVVTIVILSYIAILKFTEIFSCMG